MAVLLSIFDTRLGPISFVLIPRNFNVQIVKKTTKLMDFVHDEEFFIQEHPEHGIKSINVPLSIPSKWARGREEMAQLSILTMDESPAIDSFKKSMISFKEQLLKEPDMYMAFYTGNRKDYIPSTFFSTPEGKKIDPSRIDALISEKHQKLITMLDALHDEVRIDTPTTYAHVVPVIDIASSERLNVPRSAINELKDLAHNKNAPDTFVVFRKVGDMVKADMIPCSGRPVKIRIIVKELTPEFIMRTSQVISLPLLFTSGICQEKAGKCSYEAYFSIEGSVNIADTIARIKTGLEALDKVVSVEIKSIQ